MVSVDVKHHVYLFTVDSRDETEGIVCATVFLFYYPAAWAATHCLQMSCPHFWRVDAAMQRAYS